MDTQPSLAEHNSLQCSLDDIVSLLVDDASILDGSAQANLRRCNRMARTLVNLTTRRLKLTGYDIEHLSRPQSCPSHGLAARFPCLEELRLTDAMASPRTSESGGGRRQGPGGSGFLPEGLGLADMVNLDQVLDSPTLGPQHHHGRVTDDLVEGLVQSANQQQALHKLRGLDVRACTYLTARGLRHLLKATPNLQRFTATRWAESASLMDCPSLPHLHTLTLGDAEVDILSVDDNTLQLVAQCTSLTHLSLQRCVTISDAGLAALAALPRLKHLNIAGTRVRGDQLVSFRFLETLDASGCAGLGDGALAAMRTSRVRTLLLDGTACTNAGLVALQQVATLSRLELGSHFELTDVGLSALGGCEGLTSLTFGAFNLTRPPTKGAFPALTHVQFGGSYLNRGMRFAFPLGPSVRRVVAAGFDTVTDAHVAFLARQRSLTHLELHGGYTLSVAGLQALRQLTQLYQLTLVTCPLVSRESAQQLLCDSCTGGLQQVTLRQSAWEAPDACLRLRKLPMAVTVGGCALVAGCAACPRDQQQQPMTASLC